MARTVNPAWPSTVPSEQLLASVPWLSQNCSFRITKPIPGNSITVLGGGEEAIGIPSTTSPANCVPLALEEAPDLLAALLASDFTNVALIPHPAAEGSRQTPDAWAKLEAVSPPVVSAPLLSLCEAPALTAPEILRLSRYWRSSPPFGGISTKPSVVGSDDGSVAALATKAWPLTV